MSYKILSVVAAISVLFGSLVVTYNKGYNHAEADMKAKIAEAQINAIKVANNIDETIRSIDSSELDSRLVQWYRD